MQKVLIISQSPETSAEIQAMIERHLPYQVFTACEKESVQAQLESKVFNITIVDHPIVDEEALEQIDWLKHTSYTFPILLITNKVMPHLQAKLNLLHDIHILARPVTEKSVAGLVRKLMMARRVPKQLYRRFNTNQIAEMEALASGDSLLTSMYNLSKGGAYCEFEGASPLTIGDMIRLKVFITDTNSEYTFNAKVVWTTVKGRFSGRFGCGFKFVSSKDAYRSLLSKS
jgi:DNA-binding NarL/FixJ family response regulator